jgi:hypothetical protein
MGKQWEIVQTFERAQTETWMDKSIELQIETMHTKTIKT